MMKNKSMFVIERERMYTSNPCNPVRDGRITPENVHPKAKNPIIAGFFREIGRADRLGSGIRNLYKYCKDYGGFDPVFTEGNEFVISVSLKKLDAIRFPFEKPSADSEKVHIGPEIVPIDPAKVPIGGKEIPIGDAILMMSLTKPTLENIQALLRIVGTNGVMGEQMIAETLSLTPRGAGRLLALMRGRHLLIPAQGIGKGKYRFREMFRLNGGPLIRNQNSVFVNPVNPV